MLSLPTPSNTSAPPPALTGSTRDFLSVRGPTLSARASAFSSWLHERIAFGGFPFSKKLLRPPAATTSLRLADGSVTVGLNFASQDYLNLSSHPYIHQAVLDAPQRFGPHSGGAPVLAGAIELSTELESALAQHLGLSSAILCPTGWAAGYGAIRALIRDTDHIVIDQLAHNCLHEGAAASTRNLHLHRHLDLDHVRLKLASIRARDRVNAILVVTEGLFSMDADTPDLAGFIALCRQFNASLLVDVAHDLGSTGPRGTGSIGAQNLLGQIDLVVGSFSKTFATNGGFIATRDPALADFLRYLAPATTFSSALTPPQVATALAALQLVRSNEGDRRRAALLAAAQSLRSALSVQGLPLLGHVSPIVPVLVGSDDVARIAARTLSSAGILANLIEYPAVSRATARFRLQVMSDHTPAACTNAAHHIAQAIASARFARRC